MTAHTLAITNLKGGVGKSSTTYHLARAAHLAKKKTLVVDTDPQGNITSWLSAEQLPPGTAGLADALSTHPGARDTTIADVTVSGLWSRVDLVPTVGPSLTAVREEISVATIARERRLANALRSVADDYDLILIDCPPTLDQLTINAFTAANSVLVVTEASKPSLDGVAQTRDAISELREAYNPGLLVHGVLVNSYESRSTSDRHWLLELRGGVKDTEFAVLDPLIPTRVAISRAPDAGMGLDEWPGADELAQLYTRHLKTLTKNIRKHAKK